MGPLWLSVGTELWLGILTSISPCPLATNVAGIFAGGDMVSRDRTVTTAVGHGKHAARHIDAWLAGRMGRKISGLAPSTADQLLRYEWPGNVRELENAMERALIVAAASVIGPGDLPLGTASQTGGPTETGLSLADIEKQAQERLAQDTVVTGARREQQSWATLSSVSVISRAEGAVSAESWQAMEYDAYMELLDEVQP